MYKNIDNLNVSFKPGSKIRGTIISIDKRSVFVDVNAKSEGIINREELLDKDGNLTVAVGDEIEAYFVSENDSEITLSVKMTGKFISHHLEDAYYSGIPVEGKVAEERKGGYLVKVAGKDGFCPYSQIDLYPKEPVNYIGNIYTFIITELNKFNTVLSRRKLLEKEKAKRIEQLKETLAEGDILPATVISVKDFGVFVDLDGCEGFIPISELAWGHVSKADEIVKNGDKINVAVKALDWTANKITLSYRSAQTPWSEIAERYPIGKTCKAKITRLASFGAFAELEKGLEGLIHISKLSPGKRINHAKESVSEGEIVTVVIDDVDIDNERISLVRDFADGEISETAAPAEPPAIVEPGAILIGTVETVKTFGVFVKLNPFQTGLLHVSEVREQGEGEISLKELNKRYPAGSMINVMVKSVENGRISLALAEKKENAESAAWKEFSKNKSSGGKFSSTLADALDGLKIE